ncbi:MAG: pyridoxal-phosphate dependent enzyme [Thermoplasmatota archaeon]
MDEKRADTMDREIIKRRVGRTPIIRAEKLEKELDVGRIYLKLEGNNPSGHREDRLAYLIIRDALTRGKKTICLGTYGTVGGSLSHLSSFFDVKCVFYVPNKRKALRRDLLDSDHVEIIEYGGTFEDCVRESRKVAREKGWYDANPGLANNMMNMYAFSYIAKELNSQLEGEITDLYCQTSGGSSISGLHMGFKQLWINEDITTLPRINAVSTSHGNAIVESFKERSRSIITLDPSYLQESKTNRNVVNWECFNGQDALNTIYDTHGMAIGVSDWDLKELAKYFRKLEKVRFTIPNFYPLAAFIKEARDGNIKKGSHVIILNDGKVEIELKVVKRENLDITYDEFLDLLDNWLVQFSDPLEEIKEATDNAFDRGFVICAFDRGSLVGITVLSRSNWETFFPHYHLSYIATKKDLRGMGIATQLMQKAIDLSKGSLSLHVETDNKRAIKLYEKMGLRRKYYRMLYKGPEG